MKTISLCYNLCMEYWIYCLLLSLFFRAEQKVGINNGGTERIGSSSSGLDSSGGLLSGGDSEINGSESVKVKRENILSELQLTESRYTDDLEQVLRNYRYVNCYRLLILRKSLLFNIFQRLWHDSKSKYCCI